MKYETTTDRYETFDLVLELHAAAGISTAAARRLLPDDLTVPQLIRARQAGLVDVHRLRAELPEEVRAELARVVD